MPGGKKGTSTSVWKFFKVEGLQITRLKKECPRCGKGVYLGEHQNRLYCGKCGYTTFRRKE